MREPKSGRQEAPQTPICNLNVALPDNISPEPSVPTEVDVEAIQNKYTFLREAGYGKWHTVKNIKNNVKNKFGQSLKKG